MRHFLFFLLLLPTCVVSGANDSILVESLLQKGKKQPATTSLVAFYGKQLTGVPYVGKTLEVNPTERLTVNLSSLDCTTLVENALALTLTTQEGSTDFGDFKRNLLRIRYRDGVLDGYASRNHYFSEWIVSNERLGIVQEIKGKANDSRSPYYPFVETQTLSCTYMSEHPGSYPMMKNDAEARRLIAANERRDRQNNFDK